MNNGYIVDFTISQGPNGPSEPAACTTCGPQGHLMLFFSWQCTVNLYEALAVINLVFNLDGIWSQILMEDINLIIQ